MHRDVEAADQMMARLSDLLRMSLRPVGVQEVPLKEELDFFAKYLEIEQTRFRDRLTVRFDVEPETLDALVPNLLLQPLVENAIRHGIGRARRRRAHRDSSAPAARTTWTSTCGTTAGVPTSPRPQQRSGVGLANTRSRLEHLYGSLHGLSSGSRRAGTCGDRHDPIPVGRGPRVLDEAPEDIKGVA